MPERLSPDTRRTDAADLALCNVRIRKKAEVYLVSGGLDEERQRIFRLHAKLHLPPSGGESLRASSREVRFYYRGATTVAHPCSTGILPMKISEPR